MKKIAIVIVILGVIVMLIPTAGKLYYQWQEEKMISDWYNSEDAAAAEAEASSSDPEAALNDLEDAFSSENNADESSLDTDGTAGGNTTGSSVKSSKKKSSSNQVVLGIIKIDKINIKYPIIEGVKASNLRRAIGHMPGTAGLGQTGNCALAGHRNYTFGRYFNRLDEVKEGDTVTVLTKKVEYKYKVYEKLVVKPSDVSVLKGGKDDTVLTLITCTPIYIASHRLILHARLVEKTLLQP